jgi:hypothetical protein
MSTFARLWSTFRELPLVTLEQQIEDKIGIVDWPPDLEPVRDLVRRAHSQVCEECVTRYQAAHQTRPLQYPPCARLAELEREMST